MEKVSFDSGVELTWMMHSKSGDDDDDQYHMKIKQLLQRLLGCSTYLEGLLFCSCAFLPHV